MRTLKSRRFGELMVSDEDRVDFPHGLIGFGAAKVFYLVQHKFPFFWLHCADDPELSFAVVESSFLQPVEVRIPMKDVVLAATPDDEMLKLFVLTMSPDPASSTVNLKAPLVVNRRNRKGIQLVIEDDRYPVSEPLLKAAKK